ncbi:MAG TPA: hypothetical protein VFI65_04090 [Streptosporangiaceae bacterium]|nr:hypothetical protein [Streptosporangiaceae bacterium]
MSGWRRRVFDSPGLTQAPPGPQLAVLARRWTRKIYVTSPGYDNIGQVLTSMGVAFEPFRGQYDCDLLFFNCGTQDHLDPASLARFVSAGGCLYASDLTSELISSAFPGMFQFAGSGYSGLVSANIVDEELREVVGDSTAIHFDLDDWSILAGCQGETLVEAAAGTPYAGRPLMVEVEYGDGAVFYTSFHNRAQVSEQERALLQLLVLKQISTSSNTSIASASQSLGISLTAMKKRAGA